MKCIVSYLAVFALFAFVCTASVTIDQVKNRHELKQCNNPVERGDIIQILYRGSLTATGEVFDQSESVDAPFTFQVGGGAVIEGMDEGVIGMCEMEMRKLVIPPELAYGDRALGAIPASSSLTFEVLLARNMGKNPPTDQTYNNNNSSSLLLFLAESWWVVLLLIAGAYLYFNTTKKNQSNVVAPSQQSAKARSKKR